ncbi:precorrin-3B synthase [Mesorhizobium sp. A556]
MNAFTRRGACPALSAPMQTGDGLLVRLNPATDGLAPNELIDLCEAAQRHGNGIMEITARGSLQIRGLTAESAQQLELEVDALGIPVRTGVPVETGPLAGLDPDEIADPRPLAQAIRKTIADTGLSSRLGPKVSVVIDGGGRLTMDDILADIRLTTQRQDGEVMWRLAIAGSAMTAKPIRSMNTPEAPSAVLSILQAIAALGLEGRAKDLLAITPAALTVPRENRSPVAIFPLADDAFAVGIGLPFGSMMAKKIIALAREASALGATEIRLAPQRALLFPKLSKAACQKLQARAAELGFVTSSTDPRTKIAACPGAPACASGLIATREIADEIAGKLAELFDPSFTLHISGCAKGCAHPAPATLTLVGDEKGAGLVVDGTAKSLPVGYRPRYDAAHGIGRVATAMRAAHRPVESTVAGLARLGISGIAQAYRQD